MKLLIFSDSHLTDKFDESQFKYLLAIISAADKVIINGDFWDMYITTFDKFVKSEWQRLFWVLKQKQAVYIYGNHDEESACDERVNMFSVKQAYHYDIDADGLDLHVEHGHRIVADPTGGIGKFIPEWLGWILQQALFFFSIQLFHKIFQPFNEEMKVWRNNNMPGNATLVCGHTHVQENAEIQKFINSGVNNFGYGQYLWVENGRLALHSVKYYQVLLNLNVAKGFKQ